MNQNEHNGWTNYETWSVNLWLDNEEGSQSYWAQQAETAYRNAETETEMFPASFTRSERAESILSVWLKQTHEDSLPQLKGFAADLLTAALSEVNWMEIAKRLVSDRFS